MLIGKKEPERLSTELFIGVIFEKGDGSGGKFYFVFGTFR